jgi:hypothetical protein
MLKQKLALARESTTPLAATLAPPLTLCGTPGA